MSPHCTGGNPLLLPTPNRVISLRFRPLVPPVGAVRTGEAKSRFQASKGGGHHEIPARPTGSSLVIMVPPEVRVFHFPREIAIDLFFPGWGPVLLVQDPTDEKIADPKNKPSNFVRR